jgi:nitrogen fixation NifU-like protein
MTRPYYSKKVIEHFLHPKNFGKMKRPDGVGDTQNLRCGDIMKIYIKVKKEKGKEIIKMAKFETLGCGHAIAISDMVCSLVKGKTLEQASKISYNDVIRDLGSLPSVKIHCLQLAQQGMKRAIEDYYRKTALKHPKKCLKPGL